MSSQLFQNAIKKTPQKIPPIWMMRQAGRYHGHYQKLKEKYSFMDLCKNPELAAEVAMGPIEDFDFDVSILFSDLLFPLEALGMGLFYDPGPKFSDLLTPQTLAKVHSLDRATEFLQFQKQAAQLTRERLPKTKSLIGFVGGPWTLFSYAVSGGHDGNLIGSKTQLSFYHDFCEVMIPLLINNIQLQLEGGAEIVMIFDTAAGELSPMLFQDVVAPQVSKLAAAHPGRLGYYSKGTQSAHLAGVFRNKNWAGFGVDHRWELPSTFIKRSHGFLQGNFDQSLLFCDTPVFLQHLQSWLEPIRDMSLEERAGWVCGLGHGVLPKTPEHNVRLFVQRIREELAK